MDERTSTVKNALILMKNKLPDYGFFSRNHWNNEVH